MKSKPTNFNEYLELVPEKARQKLVELRDCILEAAPSAVPTMSYGVPAYALVTGGKLQEQIMVAGYKKHVGLYPHPTTIKHFHKELETYKTAEGTVRFDLDKPLPKDLIIQMIRYRKLYVPSAIENNIWKLK